MANISRAQAIEIFKARLPEGDTLVAEGEAQNLTGGPRRHKSGEGRLFLTQKMIAHWDDADPEAVFIANWSMVQATGFKFYQAINRRIVTFSTAQGSFDFFTSRILAQTLVNMAHDATGCRHDLIV